MEVVVRKLGLVETQMALMQRRFCGSTQGCQMTVLEGMVPPAAVWSAARALFARHRGLRCAVVDREGELFFVDHSDFARIEVTSRVLDDAGERERVYAEVLNRQLDAHVALWRLEVVTTPRDRETALIFSCHHSIVDGASLMSLVEELLTLIDGTIHGTASRVDARGVPAPIDDYLLEQNGPAYRDTISCSPIPYVRSAHVEARVTVVHPLTIPPAEHERLQEIAKHNHFGLNALLGAAVGVAAVRSGLAGSPVALKTAVSLRERAPKGVGELGCYIAVADTSLEIEGTGLCALARVYERKLLTYIFKNCFRRKVLSTDLIRKSVAELAESPSFPHGAGLTNVGEVSLRRAYDHFQLKDYRAAANRNAGNNAFVVTAMSFDGELRLPITYTEPLMDRASIERVAVALSQVLTACANSGNFAAA